MSRARAALAGVVLLGGVALSQDLPHATAAHGGFAFPDASGIRLMLLSAPARPLGLQPEERDILAAAGTMTTAFCAGGTTRRVEFAGQQAPDGKSGFRQTARQFPHLDGFVFGVKDGRPLAENETCFVAADALARSVTRVSLEQPRLPGQCDARLAMRMAALRGRGVTHCWTRASEVGPGGASVALVEFARQGNSALASLVVMDGNRLIFSDMPGDYSREDGLSVWRVEDEGAFHPEHVTVVLLARRASALVLATNWTGAEGTVLGLYESDGDRFRPILLDYWYQAPL